MSSKNEATAPTDRMVLTILTTVLSRVEVLKGLAGKTRPQHTSSRYYRALGRQVNIAAPTPRNPAVDDFSPHEDSEPRSEPLSTGDTDLKTTASSAFESSRFGRSCAVAHCPFRGRSGRERRSRRPSTGG